MKALSKKSLILVLSLVFALSALMFAFSFKNVKAETGTSVGTFTVMEAAQVRRNFDGKGAGLRFRVKMDYQTASYVKANDDVTMGFIITPHYYFENRAAEAVEEGATPSYGADDYIQSIEKYVDKAKGGIIVDENTIYVADAEDNITAWESTEDILSENQSYYVNGALVGILEKNLSLDFTVIAYIYDGTEYAYAVPSASFARNVYDTANTAYWDKANERESIEKAFDDWYATASYPIKINNKAQYEEFAESTATDKFEGDYLQIAAPIDLGAGNGSELKVVSSNFAGTLSKASKGTLVYENTENVGEAPVLAEEGSAAASVLADTIEVYDPDKVNIKPTNIYRRNSVADALNSSALDTTHMTADEVSAFNAENNISTDLGAGKTFEPTDVYGYTVPVTSLQNHHVDLSYTWEAYQIFADNGKFNSVEFEFMIACSDVTYVTFRGQTHEVPTLVSCVGYSSTQSTDRALRVPTNQWISAAVNFETVGDAVYEEKTLGLSLNLMRITASAAQTFYVSEIRFVTNSDINNDYIIHKGDLNWYASEQNASDTISLNTGSITKTFMTNAEVEAEVAVTNPDEYDGNAIKLTGGTKSSQYIYLYMPYGIENEYKKLVEMGEISKMKTTYMITSGALADTACAFNKSGLEYNTWYTVEIDLKTADWSRIHYDSKHRMQLSYVRFSGTGVTIYIGDIEFS